MDQQKHFTSNHSRVLGVVETFYANVENQCGGHNQISVVAKIQNTISDELYRDTMAALFELHKMFRTIIQQKDAELIFRYDADINDIPLQSCREGIDENWKALYENELNTPLDLSSHCWRSLLFVPSCGDQSYLILTCSHAVADGLSVAMLVKDFLSILNCNENARNIEGERPIDHALDAIYGVAGKKKGIDWTALPKWPYMNPPATIANCITKNEYREINIETVNSLIAIAKREHLTLNNLMCGIYLQTIKELKPSSIHDVSIFTPINLRSYAKPRASKREVLSAALPLFTSHDLADSTIDSIQFAKDYAGQLKQKSMAEDLCVYSDEDTLSYIDLSMDRRDGFFMGFGISNLGRFDFETSLDDLFHLDGFYFSGSRKASDCPILLCLVTSATKMSLVFNYTFPHITSDWVSKFADRYINNVTCLLKEC